ncbi:MAG: UvrD-helicase domain-containing protein [Acidobacteriota bacterium]|nr:UvrD-helicase domain-containing protein [Acidobacteriota bacterium]
MTDLSDRAARHRIESDFATNLLVEAGAGSGKTHEMALRMARGIASGAYLLEHMAAVTFTRKAASELRGRFQQALESELRTTEDPARVTNLRAALGNLERFFAGTIHAFCAHLLRQHPVEAGLSPVFEELDEVQDQLQREQAWRDFLRQARAEGHPLLQELREANIKQGQLDSAFATLCEHEDVEFDPGTAPKPAAAGVWKQIDAFANDIGALLPSSIDPETTCKLQQRWPRFLRALKVTRRRRDSAATLASVLSMWDATPGVTQNRWEPKSQGKEAQVLWEAFRADSVAPFMTTWRRYLYRVTVSLLTGARAHASNERKRRNTLNYNDLLLYTARVLRERPDVRADFQEKLRHLFVDEFQDTDPLQAEIIFLLAGLPGRSADWRDVTLRDGALFVVGDPKQSIYRFRRADIEIYNQVRERIDSAPNGDVVLLTTNFRSTAALCDWANGVFKKQFPSASTPTSPAFSPLEPRPGMPVTSHPAVLRLPVEGRGETARVMEAEGIARYIRAEIDAGRRHAGDFLILTRKKKPLGDYMAALERLSVPLEVSGAGAFAESAEVAALAQLLRVLGDPQDAVTLIGVLRGPLFGVSDRELWEWKKGGGAFNLFAEDTGPYGRAGAALAALRRYYRWTRVLPLAAAVERVLDDTGFLALAATSPDGVEAGDLVHAVDRVRRTAEQGGTLADAADALGDDQDGAADVESLPLEPGRSDVVRLMNLHKAKGLEAKVVFLADPTGGFSPGVSRRIVRKGDRAEGWLVVEERSDGDWYRPPVKIAEPDGWEDHVTEEQEFLRAEETRLLYVAATRAEEMLVVGCSEGKASAWKTLEPFLSSAPELKVPSAKLTAEKWKADVSDKARAKAAAARDAAHAAAREASWSASSVTGEAKHMAKLAREAEGAADDPTRVVTADTRERRADAGMAWGTLVHGLLEHAMRHDRVEEADLQRLALWLTVETPDLRPIIDEAIATVREVMQSDFWKTAKSAEHLVETPFAVQTGKRDVLFGMIDLMFKTKDAWRLVDYKTDATMPAPGADGRDRYALQLKAYENAMKKCNVPTDGAVLHSVRRGTDS